MSKIEQQYLNLLKDILENGTTKSDRTGTGTISVFGRQLRHDFRDGFPLLTTKRMAFKAIVTELLWFLRGETNIKYLVDNGCHIWDGDTYKNYCIEWKKTHKEEPPSKEQFIQWIKDDINDGEFVKKWGELGPVYGKQWRNWSGASYINPPSDKDESIQQQWYRMGHNSVVNKTVDQIQNLINDLKTNPDSRRLMVSAWNVGELDQMVLPPCHYGFQVYTRELSLGERGELFRKTYPEKSVDDFAPGGMEVQSLTHQLNTRYNNANIPTRAISLMWNQRSVDTFLGLPFNIASYGLLLMMIAKEVNMVPDELIGNLGDCHLYLNHIEQAKEQLGREYSLKERIDLLKEKKPDFNEETGFGIAKHIENFCHLVIDEYDIPRRTREPHPLPTLNIESAIGLYDLFEYLVVAEPSDFKIENYRSHPTIKAPLSN